MSYYVVVQNQCGLPLKTYDGATIQPNETWKSGLLGSGWVSNPQFGALSFTDVGDKHLPGDTSQTWGVLVSYQGRFVVARYEGGGILNVTFSYPFQQVLMEGMDFRVVKFNPLVEPLRRQEA